MKTREFQLPHRTLQLTGSAASIAPLIEGIRSSPSENPEALPLRGGKGEPLPSWASDPQSREENRSYFSCLKARFLSEQLQISNGNGQQGLYFFVGLNSRLYYVGKGTREKGLHHRLGEQIKDLDFILFAIAYPQNLARYKQEALRFYGSKKSYQKHRCKYKLEFECLTSGSIDRIAWITCDDLTAEDWEEIETNFISFQSNYDPCSNIDKTEREFSVDYLEEFYAVEEFLALLWKG